MSNSAFYVDRHIFVESDPIGWATAPPRRHWKLGPLKPTAAAPLEAPGAAAAATLLGRDGDQGGRCVTGPAQRPP